MTHKSGEFSYTKTMQYLVHVPGGYGADPAQRWPLVLFLHGAGERGSDLSRVAVHGIPKLVEAGHDLPFVAVSPQCPEGRWWDVDLLSGLLDEISAAYRVDPDRVYVTGLSMGGFGTWALAAARPELLGAIAPICGGGDVQLAGRIKDIPAWVFHGAKDDVVPLSASQEMVSALEALGAMPKFTIYPEANHDSWTETYDNPDFYEWLLSQRRKPASL